MFRIKTALLACLLLVAGLTSVTCLSKSEISPLSNFGDFLVNHQEEVWVTFGRFNSTVDQILKQISNKASRRCQTVLENFATFLDQSGSDIQTAFKTKNISVDLANWKNLVKTAIPKAQNGDLAGVSATLGPIFTARRS